MKTKVIPHRTRKAVSERAAHEQAEPIDLSRMVELRRVKEFTEKFLGDRLPSLSECCDAADEAFVRAGALLEYCASAAEFENECGTRPEAIEGWVIDSVQLHLQMLYVANKRLLEIS